MKGTMLNRKTGLIAVACAAVAVLGGLAGCATMDRAYKEEVSWTNAPTVHIFTNTVVVTNTVAQIIERQC